MAFLKRNLYVMLGALCVLALGSLYLYERYKPSAVVQITRTAIPLDIPDNTDTTPNTAATEDSAEPRTIKVHIVGAVVNAGVYEVPENTRIDDVLKLAGGQTEEADLSRVNLAAYVKDAQQVVIPTIEDNTGQNQSTGDGSGGVAAGGESDTGLININTAGAAMLETLPGIGSVIAQSIIDYRTEKGGFKTVDEIKKVSRIGEATFAKIKDKITVD